MSEEGVTKVTIDDFSIEQFDGLWKGISVRVIRKGDKKIYVEGGKALSKKDLRKRLKEVMNAKSK